MKVLAIIVNFFIPGLGTLFVGKIGQGIIQIILWFISILFVASAILAIIGIPLILIDLIWAISCVLSEPKKRPQRYRD